METLLCLSDDLLRVADQGVEGCDHDACQVVYGLARDFAYKLQTAAQERLAFSSVSGVRRVEDSP